MPSALAREYREELAGLRRETVRAIEQAWNELPAIRQDQMGRWLQTVLPVVDGGRRAAVSLTDGYMAGYLQAAGEDASPLGLDPDDYRRPSPDGEVYARPFVHTYTKQSEGMDPRQARQFGGSIATTLANTDVQLGARGAANQWTSTDTRIVGYRRVISPSACSFCTTVATRRYRRSDLLPLHDNCGCAVEPIVGSRDPGPTNIDLQERAERLGPDEFAFSQRQRELMREGRWGEARELMQQQVAVRQHGELGPVLREAGHQFATP